MELAMDSLKDKYEFIIRWEPFLLRPDMPEEGKLKPVDFADPVKNPGVTRLKAVGAPFGIDFAHKAPVTPNTLKAHALLDYAKKQGDGSKQDLVSEKVFKKYFTDGDVLKDSGLLEISDEMGFDRSDVQSYINNKAVLEETKQKALRWSAKGVSGVPMYYMNGQKMFSGAQDKETFIRAFEMAAS